ncbi:MAG TPA: alpha/beta fold hydrolase, partial [Pseudomonadales bacterium]|nr:alpha/beta fold hydrolase [Pseudomonadales bacterium]
MTKNHLQAEDIRGLTQLGFDAVKAVMRMVEGMHRNIANIPPLIGQADRGPTKGLTGLIYQLVLGITENIGTGIDAVLALFTKQQAELVSSFEREAAIAALNGVLGDFLETTQNPLAIQMSFADAEKRLDVSAEAIKNRFLEEDASEKIMVFLHGLCMNHLYWKKLGGTQAEELAHQMGFTPIYLTYNTGRHISLNGKEFADLLEKLVTRWPVTVKQIVLVGHSMGGLVSRSACYYAEQRGFAWRHLVSHLYCLGSPHHGSHWERGGNWVQYIAGVSPYTFPLSRLGALRSAGITDLRYGNLLDEDWAGLDRFHPTGDQRTPLPLPKGVACHAIAASLSRPAASTVLGDGLVPINSA